jgi:hypothetical protein
MQVRNILLVILLILLAQVAKAGRYAHRYSSNQYGDRVSQLANDFNDYLDGNKLYGHIYASPVTENGRLACARVVQIILRKAGVPGFRRPLYGVSSIQYRTSGWKTVGYDDIKPGDIVFWRKAGHDEKCTGGGDCHVGIAVGNGQSLDTHSIWGTPTIQRIGWRLRWRFMYAKRMR